VGLPGGGDDEAVAAAEGGGPRGGEAGAQRRHVTMCLPAYSTNGDGDACLYEQLCLGEPLRGYKRSGLVGATHLPETEEAEPNRQSFVIRSAAKIGSRRATDISAARRAFVGCLGEYIFLFGIGWWRLRPTTAVTSSFTRPQPQAPHRSPPSLAVAAWMRASARAACPVP
jgi:hypothetical protein